MATDSDGITLREGDPVLYPKSYGRDGITVTATILRVLEPDRCLIRLDGQGKNAFSELDDMARQVRLSGRI